MQSVTKADISLKSVWNSSLVSSIVDDFDPVVVGLAIFGWFGLNGTQDLCQRCRFDFITGMTIGSYFPRQ